MTHARGLLLPEPVRPDDRDNADLDFRELLRAVHANASILVFSVLLCLSVGTTYLLAAPSLYTATARILIDPAKATQRSGQEPSLEKSYIDTQVEALHSAALARKVISDLGLLGDPELRDGALAGLLRDWVGLSREHDTDSQSESVRTLDRSAARFVALSSVTRVGVTYFVDVSVSSHRPERAARLANGLVQAYLQKQAGDLRGEFNRRAATLEDEIGRLDIQLRSTERSIAEIKTRNDMLANPGTSPAEQRFADLSQRWMAASDAAHQAAAALKRIGEISLDRPGQIPTLLPPDTPNAPSIRELASRYQDAVRRGPPLSGPAEASQASDGRQDASAIIDDLRRELAKAEAFRRDVYQNAVALEAGLHRDLDEMARQQEDLTLRRREMRNLDNQAAVLRTLYDERLRGRSELQSLAEGAKPTATLVSPAAMPFYRSAPNAKFVLGVAGIIGLAMGGGIALLRHPSANSFRSAGEARRVLGMSCLGTLPPLARLRQNRRWRIWLRTLRRLGAMRQQRRELADTMRAVRIASELAARRSGVRVIGVASALRGEGRTTLATSLGDYLSDAGVKALLVDADFQNPQLTHRVCLEGGTEGADTRIRRCSQIGCDILPSPNAGHYANQGLAGIQRVAATIQGLGNSYDFIIIDLPPCSAAADMLALVPSIDAFIMVLAAGKTPRKSVTDALAASPPVAGRALGVVLN